MAARKAKDVSSSDGIQTRGFLVRLASAAIYAGAFVGAVVAGPLAAGLFLALMAGLAASEFYSVARKEARLPNEMLGIAAAAAIPVAAALWGLPGLVSTVSAVLVVTLIWHTLVRRTRAVDTALTVFGAVYTGLLLAHLVLILTGFRDGRDLVLVLLVSVWASDVFAYLVGSTIGKHKLAPHISPKKSWEGFIAGVAATVGTWVAASALKLITLSWGEASLVGVAIAIAAVFGDLVESRFKREAGVKDSGSGLPGHGGFLDRLDSLIVVSAVAYWILEWSGVARVVGS